MIGTKVVTISRISDDFDQSQKKGHHNGDNFWYPLGKVITIWGISEYSHYSSEKSYQDVSIFWSPSKISDVMNSWSIEPRGEPLSLIVYTWLHSTGDFAWFRTVFSANFPLFGLSLLKFKADHTWLQPALVHMITRVVCPSNRTFLFPDDPCHDYFSDHLFPGIGHQETGYQKISQFVPELILIA